MHHTVGRLLVPSIAGFLLSACAAEGPKVPQRMEVVNFSETVTEGRRTVSGRLSFAKAEGHLIIETAGRQPETISAMFSAKKRYFGTLDPSATYQVDLLTTVHNPPLYISDHLSRVSRNGRVIHDESVCRVHHRPMQRQIEHGVSGVDYPDSFFPHRKEKFPNDGNAYLLCGSGLGYPVWKCPHCHEAYRRAARRYGIRID